MNNASGSMVRKMSFALALVIAAALGYLAVRYRLRMDQERADAVAAMAPPAPTTLVSAASLTSTSKPNYLPLRARVETNVVRVGTNRLLVVTSPTDRSLQTSGVAGTATPRTMARDTRTSGGAFVGDGRLTQGNSSVSGRVVLRGTPPPETAAAVDPTCGKLRTTLLTSRHYVVGSDGGLANTFVYIKNGAPAGGTSGAAPVLDQVGCEYQPYVIGVRTGQTFMVKNSDSTFHNVHALPKVPGNPEKNVAQPVKGMTSPFTFPNGEVFVQFKCEVHPWMFAYVGVVDHPWFAVTDQNGSFSLPAGLPPGQYTLAAAHLKAGEILQQINVTETGVEPVTFTFELASGMAKTTRAENH
jgi:plastocyanin